MSTLAQVRPGDFDQWLQQYQGQTQLPLVLDVREPWECATASITPQGFELVRIPMQEIPARQQELDPERPIACLCHHGMRSMHVGMFLLRQGFEQVTNIAGGIDAWSRERDAGVPLY